MPVNSDNRFQLVPHLRLLVDQVRQLLVELGKTDEGEQRYHELRGVDGERVVRDRLEYFLRNSGGIVYLHEAMRLGNDRDGQLCSRVCRLLTPHEAVFHRKRGLELLRRQLLRGLKEVRNRNAVLAIRRQLFVVVLYRHVGEYKVQLRQEVNGVRLAAVLRKQVEELFAVVRGEEV